MTIGMARKTSSAPRLLWFSAALLTTASVLNWSVAQPAGQNKTSPEKLQAMAADATPNFLVATIKPTAPNTSRQGWSFESEGRQIGCSNATLENIVSIAYGIHAKQIVDAPDWFYKEHFDINGVPDEPGAPSIKQIQHMYQQLLAERFHLVFHRETREIPIYALTVAKGGPILTASDPRETRSNAGNSGSVGVHILRSTNISMSDLALNLNFYEDRPVIDQSALPGRFDFILKWTYDVARESDPGAPPSLFTAIKEQLGLRLDAVKGPAPVLVIDRVDHPTND